jgi:hypothetical protein
MEIMHNAIERGTRGLADYRGYIFTTQETENTKNNKIHL